MKELEDIVRAFEDAQQHRRTCALATVVHVEGSAYRRAGARMLVSEDGRLTGAISGGCLEGDALNKARLVMMRKIPLLVTYDTTDDDDHLLGVGLGCNGIIHILIEPLLPDDPHHPVRLFETFLQHRHPAVIVTLFSFKDRHTTQAGTRLYRSEHEVRQSGTGDFSFISAHAAEVLKSGKPELRDDPSGTGLTAFFGFQRPAVSLVICGAGNDAIPLVNMAAELGWRTTVIDGRPSYASPLRFPAADKVVVARSAVVLSHIELDERSAVVLMTHNYHYDYEVLRWLWPLHLPYIGCLGPLKKLQRMMDDLSREGLTLTEEQRSRIYGPTGLHIGAENPPEIALSILAEIQTVMSGSSGGSLRHLNEPIHAHSVINDR